MVRKTCNSAPLILVLSSQLEKSIRQYEGVNVVHFLTVGDVDLHPVVSQQLALLLVCLALLAHRVAHWQGALGAGEHGGPYGGQAGGADRGGDHSWTRENCTLY